MRQKAIGDEKVRVGGVELTHAVDDPVRANELERGQERVVGAAVAPLEDGYDLGRLTHQLHDTTPQHAARAGDGYLNAVSHRPL